MVVADADLTVNEFIKKPELILENSVLVAASSSIRLRHNFENIINLKKFKLKIKLRL